MSDENQWKKVKEDTPLIPEDLELLKTVDLLKNMIEQQINQDKDKIQELRETLNKLKRGGTKSS